MIGVNVAGGLVGAAFDSAFSTPDSESSRGFETIEKYLPGAASEYGGWTPNWLDRILAKLNIEGPAHAPSSAGSPATSRVA